MECSICYCELTLKNIVNTRCSHTFCSSCFWKWVGNNNTCPMCRSGVVTSECLNKEFSSLRASIFELSQQESDLYDSVDLLQFESRELERDVFELKEFRKNPKTHMMEYMEKREKHLNIKEKQAKQQKTNVLLQLDTYSKFYSNSREVLCQIKWEKQHDQLDLELLNFDIEPIEGDGNEVYTTPPPRLEAQSPPPLYRNTWWVDMESDDEL